MLSSIWIFSFFLIRVITSNDTKLYIDGITLDGWEFVRDLFKENFVKGLDLGGSVAIYHEGELVVDLWGGWFNKSQTTLYDNNTLQLVFSTTKGITAIAVALCVERGWLDYSELVSRYWPEYAQNGKEYTTVADILSHRAGLPLLPSSAEYYFNWTAMIQFLEQEKPLWSPGSAYSYHALTYGHLAAELIQRVDPKQRTITQFIQDEIADPLNVEFYVGLPKDEEYRVSPLILSPESFQGMNDSTQSLFLDFNEPIVHQVPIPAANGITNARSLAKIYAALIMNVEDNKKEFLNRTILEEAIRSTTLDGELDFLTNTSMTFGMGFLLFDKEFPFFNSTIFGHVGNQIKL